MASPASLDVPGTAIVPGLERLIHAARLVAAAQRELDRAIAAAPHEPNDAHFDVGAARSKISVAYGELRNWMGNT